MQISIPLLCAFIPPLLVLLPVPNSAELFSRQRLPEMDEFSSQRSCYSQNIDPSTWKSLQCPLGNNHCWVATNCKIKKGNETIIIDQRGCTHQTTLNGTNEFYICSLHHYCEKCRVCDEDDYCNGAAGHALIISVARILMFAIGIVGVEMMLIG